MRPVREILRPLDLNEPDFVAKTVMKKREEGVVVSLDLDEPDLVTACPTVPGGIVAGRVVEGSVVQRGVAHGLLQADQLRRPHSIRGLA